MFSVGHLALGYLTGKAMSKLLNVHTNLALLFLVSILPDIDLVIPGIQHRGPTHSFFVNVILFLPFFIAYKRRTVPYFMSTVQHIVLGDLLTGGGAQIFWPLTINYYGAQIYISSLTNICIEWLAFLLSLVWMLKADDFKILFCHHKANLLLIVPTSTIVFPLFLKFPLAIPLELLIPHLIYLALFVMPILIDVWFVMKNLSLL